MEKKGKAHQQRPVVPVREIQVERNGSLGSVTGFPSIVVPGGFTKSTASTNIGVPVGIEFLGKPWNEGVLIEIAYTSLYFSCLLITN